MLDLEHLLKLRFVVGRLGEADVLAWWSSRQLSAPAGAALRRNFARTYALAAARSTFAVARDRCRAVFDAPEIVTLWHLPDTCEDALDRFWDVVIQRRVEWEPFFESIRRLDKNGSVGKTLSDMALASDDDLARVAALRKAPNVQAVEINAADGITDHLITMLAAAFAKSAPAVLIVPFARMPAHG